MNGIRPPEQRRDYVPAAAEPLAPRVPGLPYEAPRGGYDFRRFIDRVEVPVPNGMTLESAERMAEVWNRAMIQREIDQTNAIARMIEGAEAEPEPSRRERLLERAADMLIGLVSRAAGIG